MSPRTCGAAIATARRAEFTNAPDFNGLTRSVDPKTEPVVAVPGRQTALAGHVPRFWIGSADLREKFLAMGLVPTASTPAELGARQLADSTRWEPVIKASGFTPEQ